jgi:uncharacterized surface anchored protein
MIDYSFSPKSITVHAGDKVTWKNDGKAPEGHTATGKGFDSGILHTGQTYSHVFSQPGNFAYVCTLHPFMKGTVTVLASSSPTDGSPSQQGNSTGADGASGSTGSSAPATTGSGSSSTGSSGTANSDGSLPMTGSELWLLVLTGLELAAAGVLLGRLTRD